MISKRAWVPINYQIKAISQPQYQHERRFDLLLWRNEYFLLQQYRIRDK